MKKIEIALVGNPNSGKTSLFNELTGANQYVGNWPGVTVEKKSGKLKKNANVTFQDLPGIYSLSPYSPEEIIARDYLVTDDADAVLNVVDGTNLERNLYLTTQLMEIGLPVVVAVNMMDIVEKSGTNINLDKLAYGLGVPVVGMSVVKRKGIKEAVQRVTDEAEQVFPEETFPTYDSRLEVALNEIAQLLDGRVPAKKMRWYTLKLFERDKRVQDELALSDTICQEIEEVIAITEKIFDDESESIVINERYDFITKLVQLSTIDKERFQLSLSDKIDRIVTNRWLALPIFALVMWVVYYLSIQTVGTMATDWTNDVLFGDIVPNAVAAFLESIKVAPWMQALILDGIIAGVGAVLGFLPQLIVLFLCLAFLEDCGYMARIAFVMDRLFRKFGLSGKSFIPMLVATGCGVPGVMATRTIENERDRRMTIMTTTFMPCSAKLPIIGLIAGAFFPGNSFVAPSAYFIGIGAIVLSGILLKKTRLFSGDASPFIMELPAYHMPRMKNVVVQTFDRSKSFVKKAGTIIFVSSIAIWFMQSFNFRLQMVDTEHSILAALGNSIAFIFTPLGWGEWKATVAAIMGLIAKENVVGTFGILYGQAEVSELGNEIWPALSQAMTPVAGYSFLVFNLLCAPCFAAIGAIRREMGDAKWTTLAIAYQCGLAYAVSLVIYQLGSFLFEGAPFGFGQIVAVVLILLVVFGLIRKPKSFDRGLDVSAVKIL
ncbi:ferrous iron transport protein B [Vagococcus acidifermentans]|uniref:Ferrous iron transport protein B n=1 Tax=Vagococcus acidifermentans TaxID=564710 RepID=A0A430AQQ7_9ENTE|nr:ferrous iron transport protein B [Vagococcus acidifermentans]RSU10461.1 ferrous iron transport protein B [Vagococcus acidifermentans]